MSSAKVTLIGLWNYSGEGEAFFDRLTFPDGIDRTTAINNIIANCGEFELLFPNPDFLKQMFQVFSKKWYRTFKRWYDALNIEYAPLENYDRYENYTDKTDNTNTNSGKDVDTIKETNSGKDINTIKETNSGNDKTVSQNSGTDTVGLSGDDVTLNEISAYNSSAYQSDTRSTLTHGQTTTTTLADKNDTTMTHGHVVDTGNTTEHGHIIDTVNTMEHGKIETLDGKLVHEARYHGNIGVTTSQKMLNDELAIDEWNLYDNISKIFKRDFCVCVYD